MTDSKTLVASLREAIRKYKAVLADKSGEEKDDLLRVVGQAEAVADFFECGEIETQSFLFMPSPGKYRTPTIHSLQSFGH